ncbi:MAG: CBS domain-containing protein [Alphaproteobacteria bacterium]|nr:MAG: CBS domain-containing protein [Alphaproteobacteria bacterium]
MRNKVTRFTSRYPMVIKLPTHASVTTASKLMAEHNVGAIMVIEEGRLTGIFTERDLVKRVVAMGLSTDETVLGEVMTPSPITLKSGESVQFALEVMTQNHIRHLPIEENGEIIGMVSLRDLFAAITEELKENIDTKDAFIFGEVYGATSKAA